MNKTIRICIVWLALWVLSPLPSALLFGLFQNWNYSPFDSLENFVLVVSNIFIRMFSLSTLFGFVVSAALMVPILGMKASKLIESLLVLAMPMACFLSTFICLLGPVEIQLATFEFCSQMNLYLFPTAIMWVVFGRKISGILIKDI